MPAVAGVTGGRGCAPRDRAPARGAPTERPVEATVRRCSLLASFVALLTLVVASLGPAARVVARRGGTPIALSLQAPSDQRPSPPRPGMFPPREEPDGEHE